MRRGFPGAWKMAKCVSAFAQQSHCCPYAPSLWSLTGWQRFVSTQPALKSRNVCEAGTSVARFCLRRCNMQPAAADTSLGSAAKQCGGPRAPLSGSTLPLPFLPGHPMYSLQPVLRLSLNTGGAFDITLSARFCLVKIPSTRKPEKAWQSAQTGEKWAILRRQIRMDWIWCPGRSESITGIKYGEGEHRRRLRVWVHVEGAGADRHWHILARQVPRGLCKTFFLQTPVQSVSLGFVGDNGIPVMPPWGHPD